MSFLTEQDRGNHEQTHQKSGSGAYVKCYSCRLRHSCNLHAKYASLVGNEKTQYKDVVIDPCSLFISVG